MTTREETAAAVSGAHQAGRAGASVMTRQPRAQWPPPPNSGLAATGGESQQDEEEEEDCDAMMSLFCCITTELSDEVMVESAQRFPRQQNWPFPVTEISWPEDEVSDEVSDVKTNPEYLVEGALVFRVVGPGEEEVSLELLAGPGCWSNVLPGQAAVMTDQHQLEDDPGARDGGGGGGKHHPLPLHQSCASFPGQASLIEYYQTLTASNHEVIILNSLRPCD